MFSLAQYLLLSSAFSYTHLDVYKRQPQQLTELEQQLIEVLQQTASEIMEGLISVSPLRDDDFDACAYCDYASVCGFDRSLVPVSYTHLDVYKRQVLP